jgi:hypothetical protein
MKAKPSKLEGTEGDTMPHVEELIDADRMQRAADGVVRFKRNEFMERLITLRTTKPQAFAGLSPAAKLALGYYEAAKRRSKLLAADNEQA